MGNQIYHAWRHDLCERLGRDATQTLGFWSIDLKDPHSTFCLGRMLFTMMLVNDHSHSHHAALTPMINVAFFPTTHLISCWRIPHSAHLMCHAIVIEMGTWCLFILAGGFFWGVKILVSKGNPFQLTAIGLVATNLAFVPQQLGRRDLHALSSPLMMAVNQSWFPRIFSKAFLCATLCAALCKNIVNEKKSTMRTLTIIVYDLFYWYMHYLYKNRIHWMGKGEGDTCAWLSRMYDAILGLHLYWPHMTNTKKRHSAACIKYKDQCSYHYVVVLLVMYWAYIHYHHQHHKATMRW